MRRRTLSQGYVTVRSFGRPDAQLVLTTSALETRHHVRDTLSETWASGDVVRTAVHRMFGHLPGAEHVVHPAVNVIQMLLQDLMALLGAINEHYADLLQSHARTFAALDDGYAHDLVLVVTSPASGVTVRVEKPNRLPVPEDVSW